uniref:Uncharacterized protein n=1 Tax=Fagus sylvatica TaxID=28930 RepID=A0A2N9GNF4_FAGSY
MEQTKILGLDTITLNMLHGSFYMYVIVIVTWISSFLANFLVDIKGPALAFLPVLAFEGGTRRNIPKFEFQAFVDSGAQQQLYQKAVLSILNYVSYKKSDLCQIPSIDKTTFQSVMSWCVHVTHPLWLKEGGMKISFHQIQNIDSLEISHLCPGQHGFQVSYELLLVL